MSNLKQFSRGDVAARDGSGGNPVWIVYKDSVYDVTSYVQEHPGGDVLLEEAGRDATKAFDDIGHSSDAKVIMAKFKIGELIESEKKYDASGKKRKVAAPADDGDGRSCLSICTCGLLG